jgi:ADP-ribose pyrophosphatase
MLTRVNVAREKSVHCYYANVFSVSSVRPDAHPAQSMRPAMAEGGGWERLGSEMLLANRYFSLRSDRLRLPDGGIKDPYFVLERPDAAIIFPITASNEVVLVRQYRPPLEMMELGPPAGLVEVGERPEEAAHRELAEETGYTGGEWEPLGSLASSPSLKDNWAFLFLARGVEETAAPDPDEHELVEVVKVPLEDLRGLVHAGKIVSSSGVAAVMLALERLRGDT